MLSTYIQNRYMVGSVQANCIISTVLILPILKGMDAVEVVYRNAIPARYLEELRKLADNFS